MFDGRVALGLRAGSPRRKAVDVVASIWKAAGFEVIHIDQDDSVEARRMAHALGWDAGEGAMDLERDLFALYTLVERPDIQGPQSALSPTRPEHRLAQ